jgi:hypothetical protein
MHGFFTGAWFFLFERLFTCSSTAWWAIYGCFTGENFMYPILAHITDLEVTEERTHCSAFFLVTYSWLI